ncbi:leucine-rich repeat-containing protein 20 [Leptodactylus fuscus]|uniref:leucine-rich repeat-containing protein 20 n=1 Tax=Leptodactylus fuscus TaxID=238119 RepID=UPI003F4E6A32
MGEAVAKVINRINDVVYNGAHHLDLSDCVLSSIPVALYLSTSAVADQIFSVSLANNDLKILAGKFFTFFNALTELNLEGNMLEKLPHEACLLPNLKMINLAKNNFQTFPDELTQIQCIENINLEGNQIKDIPIEALNNLPSLKSVNLELNPINKDDLNLCNIKFELTL